MVALMADKAGKEVSGLEKPGDPRPAESAVAQMDIHSAFLEEMLFSRGINSFLTYIADLVTLIYGKISEDAPARQTDDVSVLHRAPHRW